MPYNSVLLLPLLQLLLQLVQLLQQPLKQQPSVAAAFHLSPSPTRFVQAFTITVTAAAGPGGAAAATGSTEEEEVVRRGAAAYSQLLRESLQEGAASSCWQQVSEQLLLLQQETLEDACSSKGEPFRELIALTRMQCIYTRSERPFPGPSEGCYLFPYEVPTSWLGSLVPAVLCLLLLFVFVFVFVCFSSPLSFVDACLCLLFAAKCLSYLVLVVSVLYLFTDCPCL